MEVLPGQHLHELHQTRRVGVRKWRENLRHHLHCFHRQQRLVSISIRARRAAAAAAPRNRLRCTARVTRVPGRRRRASLLRKRLRQALIDRNTQVLPEIGLLELRGGLLGAVELGEALDEAQEALPDAGGVHAKAGAEKALELPDVVEDEPVRSA